jgi:hypothetical protein
VIGTCIPCPPNAICAFRSYQFRCIPGHVPKNTMCIRTGEIAELAHDIGTYEFSKLLQERLGQHRCNMSNIDTVSERELHDLTHAIVSNHEREQAAAANRVPTPHAIQSKTNLVTQSIMGMVERRELAVEMIRDTHASHASKLVFRTTAAASYPFACALSNMLHDNFWILLASLVVAVWEARRRWNEFLLRQEASVVDHARRRVYQLLQDTGKAIPITQSRDHILDVDSFPLHERKAVWDKVWQRHRDACYERMSINMHLCLVQIAGRYSNTTRCNDSRAQAYDRRCWTCLLGTRWQCKPTTTTRTISHHTTTT